MQIEKKYWIDMLDADSADFRVQQNAYINMQDFRFGPTADQGFAEQLESVGGTALIGNANLPPTGITYCIGSAQDYPNRRVVFFLWNSDGNHGIYCYDYVAGEITPVLLNAQLTGGLNFDKHYLIHSARVENKCVYWTDNFNEPRRLNIDAGINMNLGVIPPIEGTYKDFISMLGGRSVSVGRVFFTYTFPLPTSVPYGTGLFAQITRVGNITTIFPFTLDWTNFPATSYQVIVFNGLSALLNSIAAPGFLTWSLTLTGGNLNLAYNDTWDMGTGDAIAPFSLDIQFYTLKPIYAPTPPIYTIPLDQAVIAWIRRQPGLPPTQLKVMENPLPSVNFIADEAFRFAYRYQYQNAEFSTLSGQSSLADFNEPNPPPKMVNLNLPNTSLSTAGYLATNFLLPSFLIPAYGPAIKAQLTRVGTGGPNAVATNIPIPLDWTKYPFTQSYTSVIVTGLNKYFSSLPGNGSPGVLSSGPLPQSIPQSGKWYISYRDGLHPTLNILQAWDWGLGDSAFPPTTTAELTLYVALPSPSKQFNRIDVGIPINETIDQDVVQVDLVANYLVSGIAFIIKSWRKSLPADSLAIANHNTGVAALSYSFYNNQAGIAIDSAYLVKPYDSVPLLAETIEVAKSRGFMANYLAGYTTANLVTSLAASPVMTVVGNALGSTIIGEWFSVVSKFELGQFVFYVLQTTKPIELQPPSPYYYYGIAPVTAVPPFPVSISTGLVYIGTSIFDTFFVYGQTSLPNWSPGPITDLGQQSAVLTTNQTLNLGVLAKAFKSNASYQLAITFYDNYGRKGGVVTNSSLLITTPNTAFNANQYATSINWTLSNANALAEIPSWAYYFSVNRTNCLRTRFFLQSIGFITYAAKDKTNNYTFDTQIYNPDLAGVAIDLTFLASLGLGYVFSKGDVVDFYLAGTYYSLGIIGQSAQYIVATLVNVGVLINGSFGYYEIYTPYQQQTDEPYFEVGTIYPVINPGLSNRAYGMLSDALAGDVFVAQFQNALNSYTAEAMSPNPKYYQSWFTDAGRPNFIDYIGQVRRSTSAVWSNTFIYGSADNGLSTFDALDQLDLSPDLGPINKLQLCSKVSKIGTIMLAICGGSATASIYLSENTLISNTGDSVVAQANSVIGSVHELKGDFGTLHPESVIELRGNVYWYDAQNGKVIQYADNGLFPISNYKTSRFWKLFSDVFKSLSVAEIEALGGRPFVFGAADPHHGELLWTVPPVLATPPNGNLPDYPSTPYPFDIFDGRGKTIVYKLYTDPNHWQGSYSFKPEFLFYVEDNLFSFSGGNLYLHNQPNYCNYYGVQYSPAVMFISNQAVNKPKSYNNFSAEANTSPSFVYMLSRYPNLQATDLMPVDFQTLEGIYYAPIYRNKLDPRYPNDYPAGLTKGEKMRTTALYVMAQWTVTNGIVQVKFCNVGYTLSLGQPV